MKKTDLGQKVWVSFSLVVVVIFVALGFYNNTLAENLFDFARKNFSEIATLQTANFDNKLKGEMEMLKNLSLMFADESHSKDDVLSAMGYALARSSCDNLFIVRANGKGITSDGRSIDVSEREYFKKVLKGESCIGEPVMSVLDKDRKIVPVAFPVMINGKVEGMLAGSYGVKELDRLLIKTYESKGNSVVITSKGEVVATTVPREEVIPLNVQSLEHNGNAHDVEMAQELKYDMERGVSGSLTYTHNGDLMYMMYTPIESSDWYMLTVIREDVMTENYKVASRNAILLTLGIMAGFTGLIIFVRYIQKGINKERQEHLKEIEYVAYHDEMTGLPNIYKFKLDAKRIIEENPGIPFAFMKMDIVNFKAINEINGYEAGNSLISALSGVIKYRLDYENNPRCACARVNADEFIVLDYCSSPESNEAKRVEFDNYFHDIGQDLLKGQHVELRYGRYFYEIGETNVDDILEKVNLAHRLTKTGRYGHVCDYDGDFKRKLKSEADIERQMHDAITKQEYKMFLQAKIDLKTEQVVGAEALVRWIKLDGSLIMPGDFIPLFEKNGFVVKLDMYMLESACKYISTRIANNLPVVPISVNFSRLHLNNLNYVSELDAVVNKYKVPKRLIEIELTESIIFENTEVLAKIFSDLHSLGYKLLMDDFGKGYSSLGSLKSLPVDVIKIDRDFFSEGVSDPKARSIIESTVQMAKKIDIQVVAEGVETKEQVDFLKDIGCDAVQGYFYSRPGPCENFMP